MRVAVLNGVNLDALDKRDPEIYGGIGLAELESQIYAWSKVLECTTRCRQTASRIESPGPSWRAGR